jgi:hypothetical protein
MKAYHYSDEDFDIFELTQKNDAGWLGCGFYFSMNETEFASYGSNKYVVCLDVEFDDLYIMSYEEVDELATMNDNEASKAFAANLINEGYKGVYFNENLQKEICIFDAKYIKIMQKDNK